MITEAMIPEIKTRVKDFQNPIFQRYLKSELARYHVCPVCNLALPDFINLKNHVIGKHPDELETPEVQSALDPLKKVRDLYESRTDPEVIGIGQFLGEKIVSTHNQHVLLSIIGKTGMGKSNALMWIGERVSEYIANVKGGKPEDYFNINNIAIMRLDSILPIMEDIDQRQFNIIGMDDIGASYSAREFNNVVNRNINKVFQTFRDTNTLVILTMPDTFLIDKVGRKLAHYQIEIVEKRHGEGISIGKLFEVVEQYRKGGKSHYHFVVYNGIKYPRVVFPRANKDLVDRYETKRKEIRKSLMADSIAAIREAEANALQGVEKEKKIQKHVQIAETVRLKLLENPKISDSRLADDLKTSRETIGKARKFLKSSGLL